MTEPTPPHDVPPGAPPNAGPPPDAYPGAGPSARGWRGRRVPILVAGAALLLGCLLGAGIVGAGALLADLGDRGHSTGYDDRSGPGGGVRPFGDGDRPRDRGRGGPGDGPAPGQGTPSPSASSATPVPSTSA